MLNLWRFVKKNTDLLSTSRRRSGKQAIPKTVPALESRQLLSGYVNNDNYDIYGNTGNSVDLSINDAYMFNYRLLSQGQYATMSVGFNGDAMIDAGEIPDGFEDTLWYAADWSEWVGNMEDNTYQEVIHTLTAMVKVKEIPVSTWRVDPTDDVIESTEFTATGDGLAGYEAGVFFEKWNGTDWLLLDSQTVFVDENGRWEADFTAPTIDPNGTSPGQHILHVRVRLQFGTRQKDKRTAGFDVIEDPAPSN